MYDIESDFVHLARLVASGKSDDANRLVKRTLRSVINKRPDLADQAKSALTLANSNNITRSKQSNQPIPVDVDSRLELLRRDLAPEFEAEPVWPPNVLTELQATVEEREKLSQLEAAGLSPTRSLLFVGPPGVGKTLAAHWLSVHLSRPLLTLDLAAVMSSFLGRTGNNIRTVLDYAKRSPSVLLLDEFDAIAKRRDDTGEIGELKRLVTVILQAVDDWPRDGLLIAATNHPELLDPAIWRRFDRVVRFPLPSLEDAKRTISSLLPSLHNDPELRRYIDLFALVFQKSSFAEITRQINAARRISIVREEDVSTVLVEMASQLCKELDRESRNKIAEELHKLHYSQRDTSRITGISRDTLRKLETGTKFSKKAKS